MSSLAEQLENLPAFNQVRIPDLWQQQAVTALREGKDVVVHAPTGAGKTLIFELWSNKGKNRGQAIYTVPTRALANDKLAEWRTQGWDVGIATGDLSENLNAPVIVATLETQKSRLIRGDGPALLVVDEYQMIGDADRGLNYELALALAPAQTQLLLLSGSVGNPHDVVKWLTRLGRNAILIRHEQRPVPLEEVYANNLNFHVPNEIRGYWPRLVAKALADDLGPILIFSPRRNGAEMLAGELARMLPTPNPLTLSSEQKLLVGDHLAKMLKSRIAYHHLLLWPFVLLCSLQNLSCFARTATVLANPDGLYAERDTVWSAQWTAYLKEVSKLRRARGGCCQWQDLGAEILNQLRRVFEGVTGSPEEFRFVSAGERNQQIVQQLRQGNFAVSWQFHSAQEPLAHFWYASIPAHEQIKFRSP